MPAGNKAKQYWVAIAKIAVLAGAFYVIWQKLSATTAAEWSQFLQSSKGWPWYSVATLLFLTIANRVIEIFKWQNLAAVVHPISWNESAKQVLSALTAGIFTPNGIGEYGAKALYFGKQQAKKIVFLNLVCNGVQMFWSIVFGLFGLLYFNSETGLLSSKTILIVFAIVVSVIFLLTLLRKFSIRGFSIQTLLIQLDNIPKKTHRLNLLLGLLRYLSFSLQYVLLFRLFGVDIPFALLYSGVAAVYLLASSLPSFQFLDFAVKGSVAIFFFGFLGVNEWIIVGISTLMWLFNVVLPVSIGSYFIIRFRTQW
ncbi:lysylphosphatidylglycerol synthase domain-containing protein [Flavobacterium silvaticum]|nr:lysylphosphatidylglycerol synthase domain-containing protein [Flavobacterium silvaticum]